MPLISNSTRYGAVAQSFHWLTVVFVGAAYLIGEGGPESRVYADERATQLGWHETFGMLVLLILVLRLVWRLVEPAPQDPPMPGWMRILSKLVHWLLYALLAAVPLSAIFGAWFEAHPVHFMGIGQIGPFVAESHDLGRSITRVHTRLGNVILWVAGLHAAAAIFRHFILRDRVLLSMLPGRRAA